MYKKGKFPEGYPDFIYGDGDGTVNKRSLEGCLYWKGNQEKPIYHQTFPEMDHMDVLRDKRVLDYVAQLFKYKLWLNTVESL